MKIHYRNIRHFINAGVSFPECYANAKTLDLDKTRLNVTHEKEKVTCKNCLKIIKKREDWPPRKSNVEIRKKIHELLDKYYATDILRELALMYKEQHKDDIFTIRANKKFLSVSKKLEECANDLEKGEIEAWKGEKND